MGNELQKTAEGGVPVQIHFGPDSVGLPRRWRAIPLSFQLASWLGAGVVASLMASAPAAVFVVLGTVVVSSMLQDSITARVYRSLGKVRFRRYPRADRLANIEDGQPVSVHGRIELVDPPFVAAASGEPAVVARYIYAKQPPPVSAFWPVHHQADETRAVCFRVVTEDGESVQIDPVLISVLEHPEQVDTPDVERMVELGAHPRTLAASCREVRFAPGDHVAIAGVLTHKIDPAGDAATTTRAAPTLHLLSPTSTTPLWLKKGDRIPPSNAK